MLQSQASRISPAKRPHKPINAALQNLLLSSLTCPGMRRTIPRTSRAGVCQREFLSRMSTTYITIYGKVATAKACLEASKSYEVGLRVS